MSSRRGGVVTREFLEHAQRLGLQEALECLLEMGFEGAPGVDAGVGEISIRFGVELFQGQHCLQRCPLALPAPLQVVPRGRPEPVGR